MCRCLRLLAVALVLTVLLPATAPADAKENTQRQIDALAAKDPAFAQSEQAFNAAREAFLHLFSGDPKGWAETFLERNADVTAHTIRDISRDDDYARKSRDAFIQKRKELTRYMTLAAKTPFTDPAFCILLRPVCLYATYYNGKDVVAAALDEYDAHLADPYKERAEYAFRRVNGQFWAAIIFPRLEVPSSSSGDKNMAFVLRVDGGSFSLSPVISPVKEDLYPGEKYPLRPEKYEYGPGNSSINECRMESVLTITNDSGPFAFRADARQAFSGQGLSYACEPKCSGFTYTWSETTQSFIMMDGTCREDDGWKPKSPFDAEDRLVPVAETIRNLADGNEAVRKHERDVETALAAFLDAFDGAAREMAREFTDGWLFDRQFPLYRLIGEKDAFAAAYIANDEPVLSYLRMVASLAKTPDARLTLLLEDFAARLAMAEKNGEEKRDARRHPSGPDLLRDKAKPAWFVSYASQRNALLGQPEKNDRQRYAYTANGLEGGELITFTYDKKNFYYHSDGEPVANTYSMRQGTDNAFWGHAMVLVGKNPDYYNDRYENLLEIPRQYILRVTGGKIAFVTPPLPAEKDFFTNPKTDDRGRVLWKAPRKGEASYFCEMRPAFTVDTATAPFTVTARDVPLHEDYYLCVPECAIPYIWDGAAYVRSAPECLPAGRWGVKENTERRRR